MIGASLNLDVGILSSQSGGAEAADEFVDMSQNLTCAITYYTQWSSQPDLGMVSSVYAGFYNQSSSTTRAPAFTCPTGNCTWSPFASLAVCASCRDVTSNITVSTQHNVTVKAGGQFSGDQRTFSLPLNNITNWDSISSATASAKKRDKYANITGDSLIMSAQGTVNGSQLISFRGSTTFLLGFSILHADEKYLEGSVPWASSHPYGTECGLELCTNIYSSDVIEGTLTEQVLHSSTQRTMNSLAPEFIDGNEEECVEYWNQLNNNSLYYDYADTSTQAIRRTDLMLFIPDQDAVRYNISSPNPPTFNISDRTLKSTLSWMKKEFASGHFVWYNSVSGDRLNFFEDLAFWNQSAMASSLVDYATLSGTFDRVADSVTGWMRDLGYVQNPIYGTKSSWVLHVSVRWPFIAFPVVTTLAGCVFCIVIISDTQRLGLEPWRDSCLAIMTHGIGDELRDKLSRTIDAENLARNVNVSMADDDRGLKLSMR